MAEDDVLSVENPDPEEDAKADGVETGVEIKMTVAPEQMERVATLLKLDAGKAQRRTIYFYDTAALTLIREGAVLRARVIHGSADDSTAKLRPLKATQVDGSWFRIKGFKCEQDRYGQRVTGSCSLTVKQDRGEIAAVAAGDRPVKRLFSDEQEDFLEAQGTSVPWDQLLALGPTQALLWKVRVRGLPEPITAEWWTLEDGPEVLELSTKASSEEADAASARFLGYLSQRGIREGGAQETKTRLALMHFTRR